MDNTTATTATGDDLCHHTVSSGPAESQHPNGSPNQPRLTHRIAWHQTNRSARSSALLILTWLLAALCLFSASSAEASPTAGGSPSSSMRRPRSLFNRLLRRGDDVADQPPAGRSADVECGPDISTPDAAGANDDQQWTTVAVDPVVAAVDERIRREALRQLELLDLDDVDARIEPLWALSSGLTDRNGDGDDIDFGFLDLPPSILGDTASPDGNGRWEEF